MPTIGALGSRVPEHAELFKKWDKLIHLMVRKNIWRLGFWFDYDDLLNHARQGLWRAHKTFDPGNGANFQTYARRVITNAFNGLHHFSKANMRRDRRRSVSVDDDAEDLHLSGDSVPADEMMIADEESSIVRSAVGSLDPRARKVVLDRLVAERTLEEIGHELGLTRERVRQIERAALTRVSFSLEGHFPGRKVLRPSLKIRTGRRPKP